MKQAKRTRRCKAQGQVWDWGFFLLGFSDQVLLLMDGTMNTVTFLWCLSNTLQDEKAITKRKSVTKIAGGQVCLGVTLNQVVRVDLIEKVCLGKDMMKVRTEPMWKSGGRVPQVDSTGIADVQRPESSGLWEESGAEVSMNGHPSNQALRYSLGTSV